MCFTNKSAHFIQIFTTVTNRQNLGDNFRINAYNTSQNSRQNSNTESYISFTPGPKFPSYSKDANFSNATNFRNEVRSFAQQFNQFQFLQLVPKITSFDPQYLTAHISNQSVFNEHNPTKTYGGVVVRRSTVLKI